MTYQELEQQAAAMRSGLTAEDFQNQPELSTVPIIRVVQPNSQNAPEGADPGMFYANVGFFLPMTTMKVTILGRPQEGRTLWTAFKAKDKHIICKCTDSLQCEGVPYVFDVERERWTPSEQRRACAACPHNPFRQRNLEPEAALEGVGSDDHCKSWRMYAGIMLPDKAEFTINEVFPFYFQIGAHVLTKPYQKMFYTVGNDTYGSWEYVVFNAKKLGVPIHALQLQMICDELATENGKSYVPLFEIVGMNAGVISEVRQLIQKTNQLQLQAASEVVDDVAADENGNGNGNGKAILTKDPATGMYIKPTEDAAEPDWVTGRQNIKPEPPAEPDWVRER